MGGKYVSDTGGSFTPHPAGQFAARCCDVVEMGWQRTQYGPKYKYRVAFFCGEWLEIEIDGQKKRVPQTVASFFTATLSERGRLRPFLESWRGRAFTIDELGRFDMEQLYGAPAFLQIIHNVSNNTTYANIKTIMQLPANMTAPDNPNEYIRAENRDDWTGPAPHPDMSAPDNTPDEEPSETAMYTPDDDLPF